jgi:hypothetical protein
VTSLLVGALVTMDPLIFVTKKLHPETELNLNMALVP